MPNNTISAQKPHSMKMVSIIPIHLDRLLVDHLEGLFLQPVLSGVRGHNLRAALGRLSDDSEKAIYDLGELDNKNRVFVILLNRQAVDFRSLFDFADASWTELLNDVEVRVQYSFVGFTEASIGGLPFLYPSGTVAFSLANGSQRWLVAQLPNGRQINIRHTASEALSCEEVLAISDEFDLKTTQECPGAIR